MNPRTVRWMASIAIVVMAISVMPGAPDARAAGPSPLEEALAGKYKGTKVSVGTTYGDEWYTDFDSSLKSFTDKTGIDVRQTMTDAGSDSFRSQVEAGNGPDVVEIGLPAQLLALARAGKVVDVTKFLDMDTLRARYDQNWLDWATMAGPTGPILAGVWTGSNMDSLV